MRLGVLSKDSFGKFTLERKVDIGILQGFANLGGMFVPRFMFYAGFFLVIAVAYFVLDFPFLSVLALTGTSGAVVVFCYESWRAWKLRPF